MAIVSKTMFTFWRAIQLISLIPIWGMLAYFVHRYDSANVVAPAEILVLFIAAVIATAWVIITFFQFHHSLTIPFLVFVVDLMITAGFIAGVVLLRGIRLADCVDVSVPFSISFGSHGTSWGSSWGYRGNKDCMMLKTSWGLGIAEVVMFFLTAVLALAIWNGNSARVGHGGKVYHP